MNRSALFGGVLALCGARALLAATYSAPWPLVPYSMYADARWARVHQGVPMVAVEEESRPTCRLRLGGFGAGGRLDLTGHLLAQRGPQLAEATRRICATTLGFDRCAKARFTFFLVTLPRNAGEGLSARRLVLKGAELEVMDEVSRAFDAQLVFPGGGCGPLAGAPAR